MYAKNVANSEGKNMIKKDRENSKIQIIMQIQSMWNLECKNKSDTNDMKVKWNYLKVIQTVLEERIGIA
jgi:hypothetical protein